MHWTAHVDDPHRLDARRGRLDAEEGRGFAPFDAAPEFLFRGQQEVLIEGIGGNLDFYPFAAAGDDREHRIGGIGNPHVMLDLGHMLFRGRLSRERPGQHEFRLEDRAGPLHDAVQRGGHPADHWMADPGLDVLDDLPGCSLEPAPI